MGKKIDFLMGSAARQPTAAAPKFWNMAETGDDSAEITLYGDVMAQQPTDWWTGQPEPGLYITPEGFMEDLARIKDKAHITVKLNSCGGDLYTGIAIHNALKALSSAVNVVVEGIAASAASVIMCAGDTVTVYPGSLIMIHGVSVVLWDALNIQDMKQLIKGMDASERAVAAIYNAKTGIEIDKLRGMMTKETWLTGAEAIENGFADELAEGEAAAEMSMSGDRKVLFVNGIQHNVGAFHNIPGTIPVNNSAKPAKPAANKPSKAAKNEGGKQHMTLEELRAQEPELVAQIEQDARNTAQSAAVAAERERLAAIDSIAASVPDQQLVHDAKYGDNPCTAQELCYRVMQQSAAQGQSFLTAYAQDGKNSGAADVSAAPNSGAASTPEEQDAAELAVVLNAYNQTKGGSKK